MTEPTIPAAEFAILARHAGLTLTEAQAATLHAVQAPFRAMLDRVRGSGSRARGAEPAHVFVPGQGWGPRA